MRSSLWRTVTGLIVFLAAATGLVASAYLTSLHVKATPVPSTQPASAPAAGDVTAASASTTAPASSTDEEDLFASICTGFEHSNCETVSESRWGRFPFGAAPGTPSISVAELGLIYFIFVICWLLLIGSTSVSRWYLHFLFLVITAFGVGTSVFFEYVMWAYLPHWCPFCVTAHVASLIIFVGTLLLWPRNTRTAGGDRTSDRGSPLEGSGPETPPRGSVAIQSWPTFHAVICTLVVFALAVALQHMFWLNTAWRAVNSKLQKENQRLESGTCLVEKFWRDYYKKQFSRYDEKWQVAYASWIYEPAIPVKTEDEPFLGPANAAHTIVLFSDIQCPACSRVEAFLNDFIIPTAGQYGGVKVIFKHYPICVDCNPHAGQNLHPQACLAAQAIEAGRILGGSSGFWKMLHWLGAQRTEMKGADKSWFVKQGQRAGYNADAFSKAMDSPEALDRIKAHIEESQQLGKGYVPDSRQADFKVTGTPTVIVDNRIMRMPERLTLWKNLWTEVLRNPAPPPPGGMNEPRTEAPAAAPRLMLDSPPPAIKRP